MSINLKTALKNALFDGMKLPVFSKYTKLCASEEPYPCGRGEIKH